MMVNYKSDLLERIYETYDDEKLKSEFILFSAIKDMDYVYDSMLIEYIDGLSEILSNEISKRFVYNSNVIKFKPLNN